MPKPTIKEQPDGNIFAILGLVQRALRNMPDSLEAFKKETKTAMEDGKTDYHGMLAITHKYVNWDTSSWDEGDDDEDEETEDEE